MISPATSPGGSGTLERETGIEPATNSLEGCDSTIELLPQAFRRAPASIYGWVELAEGFEPPTL